MTAQKKDVNIRLLVNASVLWGIGSGATEEQILANCTLEDDNNGGPKNDPTQFESNVYGGKKVRWQGDPIAGQQNDFKILIDSITDKSGSHNVLANVTGSSGKITADVKKNVANQTIEDYIISFTIEQKPNNQNPPITFPLDPKLKANT